MSNRYSIGTRYNFTLQEGDSPSPIKITVPQVIDISLYPEIVFGVYDDDGNEIFTRKLSDGDITVNQNTQEIAINLASSNTLNKEGRYYWEVEISNPPTDEYITIAEGKVKIKKQRIPN